MADTETTPQETGGTVWDAPNQQVVRDDGSPPWQEGTGGDPGTPVADTDAAVAPQTPSDGLDEMTKAELLQMAKDRNISPANNDMTKQELIDSLRAAQG